MTMTMSTTSTAALTLQLNAQLSKDGIQVRAPVTHEYSDILTTDALRFLAKLHRHFNGRRLELLKRREYRQQAIDAGQLPDFLPETARVRAGDWKGPPPAPGMADRRVEITGPVDRKMVINALNSGASTFMADFEDSNAPTWDNNLTGQINLRDANRRTISFSQGTKEYKLNEKVATLIVRPRGWHLEEKHVFVDGVPMSASLFDFGLYFFHNAHQTLQIGIGPYFYLPKMESHLEARLWNDVFNLSQYELGLPRGTIRATCLIETLLAAFEMDEFLFELREHTAGLNCLSDDSQVLTSDGYKGYDEIRAYFSKTAAERAASPLRFATYDIATKQLVYQKALALIVKPAGPKAMVEVIHKSDQAAWLGAEGEDDEMNGVSMLVTPDHDLFGVVGTSPKKTKKAPSKFNAGSIVSSDANKYAKFFSSATNGIRPTDMGPLPFVARLGLTARAQIDTFLQLYGYWLGNGSLSFSNGTPSAVAFSIANDADTAYLQQAFDTLGLVEGVDLGVHGLRCRTVIKPAWVEYFTVEHGKKYANSGTWVLLQLSKDEARLVIRGIQRAAGKEAATITGICTSSVGFRDLFVQLCMHAGYAVTFRLDGEADGVCIWHVSYHEADKFTQPLVKPARDVKITRAYSGIAWCVTVPNGTIFVRRARAVGGVVTKASIGTVMGNCGRWDYIFSTIKRLRNYREFVLPDRADVTMTVPFMANYVKLLIKTCHRRGVHAMGGMAAQIPVKDDPRANEAAFEKVRNDKLREVQAGHDGTWVAHPGLVEIALKIFSDNMAGPNQLRKLRLDVDVSAKDLLPYNVPGKITEAGIRSNISVGLHYMESWLRGVGCVPIHNLMEDAATAEISRSQLWQWMHHGASTVDGKQITRDYLHRMIDEELGKIKQAMGIHKYNQSKFELAKVRFTQTLQPHYEDFLTLICYDDIVTPPPVRATL